MHQKTVEKLRRIYLFEELPPEVLAEVAAACAIASFDKGVEILRQDDRSDDVFFVLEGSVRANSFAESGREVSYVDIGPGGVFGEFSAIDRLPRSTSVVALAPALVARMPARRFIELLERDGRIGRRLIEILVAKVRSMSERLFEVSALSVRERVRNELLRLARVASRDGADLVVRPAPTHQEIAAAIGSHREAVTRELKRLEATGLIRARRREIRIPNLPSLRRAL